MKKTHTLTALLLVATGMSSGAASLATFEEGGGAYETGFHRAAPTNANVLGTEDGDSFWHLLHNGEGSGGNYVSIASTGTAGWASASFTMDLRASGPDNRADGFSVGFLDVATHGASGVTKVNSEEERGLYDNSIGVGFRTFNGANATVNYSGAQSGDVAYDLPSPGEWGSLQIDLDRGDIEGEVLVSATMFNGPGQTGLASDVFDSYSLTGVTDLDEFRMQVAGRTGGASMNLDIDNLRLLIDGGGRDGLAISAINSVVVPGQGGNPDTLSVTITWNSREGRPYVILASEDMAAGDLEFWDELDDNYLGEFGQETTSFTETGLPIDTLKRFYIVRIPE